jgi:light-regulated signal transduction histidine kinase (bacteriophytochrome)
MEHGSPPANAQEPMVPWPEAETQRIDARIAALEREKSDGEAFAAMAAHELLTSVVMIDAYATTAADHLDEGLQGEAHRDIDALRRAAARTRLLVETLLHDARSHERPLRRRAVDLNLLLRECLTLLAPEIKARGAEVQVAELPEVHGEQALIGAVFTNLLLNALRYGPARARRHPGRHHPEEPRLVLLRPEPGPDDPRRGSRTHLRALPPRSRRLRRSERIA